MADTSLVVNEANHSMADLTESMKEISTASEETARSSRRSMRLLSKPTSWL